MARQGVEVTKVLNQVTATTTSDTIDIANAEEVGLIVKRENHTAGSSTFKIEVSINETDWIQVNRLVDNVTNTNAQGKTRIAEKVLSSDTVDFVTIEKELGVFKYARVTVTHDTDGTHSAWISIKK